MPGGVRLTGIILSLISAILFVLLALLALQAAHSGPIRFAMPWIPELGLSFSFYFDGLSALFGLIISGIGFFIFLYSQEYLSNSRKRVFLLIFLFLLSMLGVVCVDNLILLFIFWELTSITSYLLIGFNHEDEESRFAALQALIVTAGAGLALLAGIILLFSVTGSVELSELLVQGARIQSSPLYLPILVLFLLGAFAKSAQAPFHFWLPGAMTAPTPISAFLHSATMVKAGIYLMARLHPVLGGSTTWQLLLLTVGGITMCMGAIMALPQRDLKKLLAYTTVSALGMMTFLLGLGTETALRALIVYILVHALYKAALFLIVGAIDHEVGTRNLCELGGLRELMPRSFAASLLALLAMCGMLPFLGFISKELIYEAAYHSPVFAPVLLCASFFTNALTVFAALLCGALPFMGEIKCKKNKVHEAPCCLWLPPLILGILGLLWGVAPASLDSLIVSPAFLAIAKHSTPAKLALWHGYNPVLALSVCTFILGLALFLLRAKVIPHFSILFRLAPYGPGAAYRRGMTGFLRYAERQTMFFQNGSLHRYVAVIIALFILVFGTVLLSFSQLSWPEAGSLGVIDVALLALIIIPALAALDTDSRIASVLELSAVGFGVTLFWIVYGAPDLALTQLLVETLTFVLIIFMVRHLPKYREATAYMETKREKIFDAFIAFIAASAFVVLLLQSQVLQVEPPISSFFAENSLVKAHGRNVVNVILVDFRGLDTLGEITVVGLAALGIIGLLQMRKTSARKINLSGRAE